MQVAKENKVGVIFFFYKEIYEKNNDLKKVAQNAREDEKILSGELKKKNIYSSMCGKVHFFVSLYVFF